jgi:hypothetical protein
MSWTFGHAVADLGIVDNLGAEFLVSGSLVAECVTRQTTVFAPTTIFVAANSPNFQRRLTSSEFWLINSPSFWEFTAAVR